MSTTYKYNQKRCLYGDSNTTAKYYDSADVGTMEYSDKAVSLSNNDFTMTFVNSRYICSTSLDTSTVYYLKFDLIKCLTGESEDLELLSSTLNFNLVLCTDDYVNGTGTNQVYQRIALNDSITCVLQAGETSHTYEYLFKPNQEGLRNIYFEIVRTKEDCTTNSKYQKEKGVEESSSKNGRIIYWGAEQIAETDSYYYTEAGIGSYCYINNFGLYPMINLMPNITFDRIGIQAPAGTMFSLGDDAMRIGRRGIYENTEDLTMDYLAIVPPTTSNGYLKNTILVDYREMINS